MVDKLKVGQTKQQVRLILGTPLLVSAFRDNRWDYVYEFTRQGKRARAPQVHRLLRRRQARALGRRRDAGLGRRSSTAIAADRALRADGRAAGDQGLVVGALPRRVQGQLSDACAIADRRRRRPDGPGADRGDARATRSRARRGARRRGQPVRRPRCRRAHRPRDGRDRRRRRRRRACAAATCSSTSRGPRARSRISRRARGTASALVVGTTGLHRRAEERRSPRTRGAIPIVFAPNMSVGVNVLLDARRGARRARSGPAYDIEIVEMHHRHKVDAPSGTALRLGEAARAGAGRDARRVRGLRARRRDRRAQAGHDRLRDAARRRRRRRAHGDLRRRRASASSSRTARRRGRTFAARRAARRAVRRRAARRRRQPGLSDMRDVLGLR